MSYRGGRYSSDNRQRYRNSGRNDMGFRDRPRDDTRRKFGGSERRRDDFKRFDDRRRIDNFESGGGRNFKRKFRNESPRRRSNDFRSRQDASKDYKHRGGSDRRYGTDRDRSGSSRSGNSSNRYHGRSENNDRNKMPPPKAPRNTQKRIDRRTLGRARRDAKMSLIHKRLAAKHARRDNAREIIAKRIKMAKMRSTLRRTTKIGTRLPTIKKTNKASIKAKSSTNTNKTKVKKQSESADKDDEIWDDDEKQIHEEEMAAKKAAEALHESNSGDDVSKKGHNGDKHTDKIKRERVDSTMEQDTAKSTTSEPLKRVPMNLTCVHCKSKCLTSMEYKVHLDGRGHRAAMSKIAAKQKQQLARMRQEQRDAQKEADESAEKDARSKHCQLCRLFYKQTKEEHQQSEDHKNIKKFLMPYCHVCKIGYKSPMAYETHRSSMHHLRSKARLERYGKIPEDQETELDLDNFTTVDEVGEIDGDDDNDVGSETQLEEQTQEHQDFSDEEPGEINVGSEHIKQVQVSYCELCSMYISHHGDQEKSLSRHCVLRSHLRNYIRYKDDKALKAEAEALHKKRKQERELKEKLDSAKENGDTNTDMETSTDANDQAKTTNNGDDNAMTANSETTENGDMLDISIKKEKDDSFNLQEEDEGVAA